MTEYICINPACIISQSKATFMRGQKDCPVCYQALEEKSVSLSQQTPEPIPSLLSMMPANNLFNFENAGEIVTLAKNIIAHYPPIIGHKVELLLSPAVTYQSLCYGLKGLYFHTVRFTALIGLSHFVHDIDTAVTKPMLRKLAELRLPFDSTWKEILVHSTETYLGKKYFITGFPEIIDELNDPEKGYTRVIKDNLRKFSDQPTSILQAGIWIRNALHHDNSVLSETDYERICCFYADIVFSMLKNLQFLKGERYWYVVHHEKTGFLKLHGKVPQEVKIDAYIHEGIKAPNQFFIYDTMSKALMPLTPFFLMIINYWDKEGEAALERIERRSMIYETSNSREKHVEGFEIFQDLLKQKNSEIRIEVENLTFPGLIALAQDVSWETLYSGYINKKYFPDCYVKRAENEQLLNDFLDAPEVALLLTGSSGIGKSALLADWVYQVLKENKPDNHFPLFINCRNIVKREGIVYPMMHLFCDELMLEPKSSIKKLLETLHQIWSNTPATRNSRLLLIIDAINEGYSTEALFGEIDEWISYCWKTTDNTPRYSWLKIVFSIRASAIESLFQIGRKVQRDSLFKCEQAYFKVPLTCEIGGQIVDDKNITINSPSMDKDFTPIISLNPLNGDEVLSAISMYAANKELYPNLKERSDKLYLNDMDIATLGNPFFLRLFLDLLERGEADFINLPGHTEIVNKYYRVITKDILIRHVLHSLCQVMLVHQLAPEAPIEVLARILDHYNIEAIDEQRWSYADPLERLLSEGVLSRRFRFIAGELPQESIVFTQQSMGEWAIYHYLVEKHGGSISLEALTKLLNTGCDFEEYNGAISLVMQDYWQDKQVEGLFMLSVNQNPIRYRHCLIHAIYGPIKTLLERRSLSPSMQQNLADDLNERIDLIIKLGDRLNSFPDILQVFDYGLDIFGNHIGAFPIYECIIQRAFEIGKSIKEGEAFLNIYQHRYAIMLITKGQLDEALEHLYNCLEIYRQFNKYDSQYLSHQAKLVIILASIGRILIKKENLDEAMINYAESLKIAKYLYENNSSSEYIQVLFCNSLNNMGTVLQKKGMIEEAMQHYLQCMELNKLFIQNNPTNAVAIFNSTVYMNSLGSIYEDRNLIDDAILYYKQSLDLSRSLVKMNPQNESSQANLISSFMVLAGIFEKKGQLDKTLQYYAEALETTRPLVNINRQSAWLQTRFSLALEGIGLWHQKKGLTYEALQYFTEDVDIRRRISGNNPQNEVLKFDLVMNLKNTGENFKLIGQLEEAVLYYIEAFEITSILLQSSPQDKKYHNLLIILIDYLEEVFKLQNKQDDVLQYYEKYLETNALVDKKYLQSERMQNNLFRVLKKSGSMYLSNGQVDKAILRFNEGVEIRRLNVRGNEQNYSLKEDLANYLYSIGDILIEHELPDQAIVYYSDSVQIFSQFLGRVQQTDEVGQMEFIELHYKIGRIHLVKGQLNEALHYFTNCLELSKLIILKNPNDLILQGNHSVYLSNVGSILIAKEQFEDGLHFYVQSIEISNRYLDFSIQNGQMLNNITFTLMDIIDKLNEFKPKYYLSALLAEQSALKGNLERSKGEDEKVNDAQLIVSNRFIDDGNDQLQRDSSLQLLFVALETTERISKGNSIAEELLDYLSIIFDSIGDILDFSGKLNEAFRWFVKGLEISEKLISFKKHDNRLLYNHSLSLFKVGLIFERSGMLDEAYKIFSQSLEIRRILLKSNPLDEKLQSGVNNILRRIEMVVIAKRKKRQPFILKYLRLILSNIRKFKF